MLSRVPFSPSMPSSSRRPVPFSPSKEKELSVRKGVVLPCILRYERAGREGRSQLPCWVMPQNLPPDSLTSKSLPASATSPSMCATSRIRLGDGSSLSSASRGGRSRRASVQSRSLYSSVFFLFRRARPAVAFSFARSTDAGKGDQSARGGRIVGAGGGEGEGSV